MNILVFGSDSSAHVLAWKLTQSKYVDEVILAPGNGGTNLFTPSVPLTPDDRGTAVAFVLSESVDLVVADGVAMQAGLTDELRALPLPVVGASRRLTARSRSRCATHEWLYQHALPLPRGRVCVTQAEAEKFAATLGLPLLVAADHIDGALIMATERAAVPPAIADCFGAAGSAGVVVEELVPGPLVTASFLTDGEHAVAVPAARLHPPTGPAPDAATWPGTPGGAGVHSAATPLWARLETFLEKQVRQPLAQALRTDGYEARGWISTACIVGQRGPVVRSMHLAPSGLELAATLPRLANDLLPLLIGCARGTLAAAAPPKWTKEAVVGVTLQRTRSGHAQRDVTPDVFEGFEPGLLVFHHGTKPAMPHMYVPRSGRPAARRSGRTSVMAGTRSAHGGAGDTLDPTVGIVVAHGPDISAARDQVYTNLRRVQLVNLAYSEHIGSREL